LAVRGAREWPRPLWALLLASLAFTLTSGWLQGGVEWSALYTVVPAYHVEYQVAWFVPLILLVMPVLLFLVTHTLGITPTRSMVAVLLTAVGLRLVVAWTGRLLGGRPEDAWPLAEQAGYLLVFAVAALLGAPASRIPANAPQSAR
jgi:hypothetical protein